MENGGESEGKSLPPSGVVSGEFRTPDSGVRGQVQDAGVLERPAGEPGAPLDDSVVDEADLDGLNEGIVTFLTALQNELEKAGEVSIEGEETPRALTIEDVLPPEEQARLHKVYNLKDKHPELSFPELWRAIGEFTVFLGNDQDGYFARVSKGAKIAGAKKPFTLSAFFLPKGSVARDHIHRAPPNTQLPGEVTWLREGSLSWADLDCLLHIWELDDGIRVSPDGSRDAYLPQTEDADGLYVWFEGADFPEKEAA